MTRPEGDAASPRTGSTHRLELSVPGLSCAGDAAPLARRLESRPGVLEALINPITEQAVVRLDPNIAQIPDLLDIFDAFGADARRRLIRWHAPAPGCLCGGCRERLEARLRALPGIEGVVLNPDENSVTVECMPARVDPDHLVDALTTPDRTGCRSGVG